MTASAITPVTLLTGYLGSGKTTLLNHILNSPDAPQTAVLINEFGAVSIDHLLVREANENIQVLHNGCVCCSVSGDMVRILRELYFKRAQGEIPAFTRLVIETTGLADPAPIMHTLLEMPLVAARYTLSGVVTTVDVTHIDAQLDAHPESVKQIAIADRIVFTKLDIADPVALAKVRARVRAINPGAITLDALQAQVNTKAFFATGLYQPEERIPDVTNWLRAETYRPVSRRHQDGIGSISLEYDMPIELDRLVDAIEMLQDMRGEQLLRVKGIVNVRGESQPRVVHAVQHTLYPIATLANWPDTNHRTRLVFITRDFDVQAIRDNLDGFLQQKSLEYAAA
jgi:G3E family GTPase